MNSAQRKVPLKYGLLRSCSNLILVPLRELRFLALTRRGVGSVPPTSVKVRIIRSELKLHQPGTSFIETGTYLGDTVALVRRLGHRVVSIELDPILYARAQRRFAHDSGVVLIQGDCVLELPKVLRRINRPAVLWLDAHYSGGITARGSIDDPILACLAELRGHPIRSHSLLIDDASSFDGRESRPDLLQVLHAIRAINSEYRIDIHSDIIAATIDRTESSDCDWKVPRQISCL